MARGPGRPRGESRDQRRTRATRHLATPTALQPLTAALLALRDRPDLLGQAQLVRRHEQVPRDSCWPRTRRSTGTPSTSATAASATGWTTTWTGRCRATASGGRRCRSGAARTTTSPAWARCAELSALAGRDLGDLDPHRPGDRRGRRAVSHLRARRPAGSSRSSTRGSTRGRCPRPRSATRTSRAAPRRCSSRRSSSSRRSTRRAAGSTRCSR